uniref:Uncharacterized protein n=1 Tax=Avena sativa TaxID=4498 RepID=A0ACD5TYK2_AVESA
MKKKLRLLAATEEAQSSVNGQATIQAPQGVTVVLTVPVHGARLARTVAIQWHRTREGVQKTGTPSADGVTTITYNFAADRPGTFIYHARYRRDRDRATGLVDVRASEAGPSAVRQARTHAAGPSAVRRARTAARHAAADVPRRDDGSAGGGGSSSARTAVPRSHGDGLALARCWGMVRVSVEAQLMGDCPVIYYDDAEYGGGAPVLGLLRRPAAALAAAALWVSGICGPRDPDMHPRRGSR